MRIEFRDQSLEALYTDLEGAAAYPEGVVKAYIDRVNFIKQAPDERVFWQLRGLRFEKLKGKFSKYHGMRLNNQYRLIITLAKDDYRVIIERIDNHDYR